MFDVWVDGEKWATTLYGVAGNYSSSEPGKRRLTMSPHYFEGGNAGREPICTEEIDQVVMKKVSIRPHVAGATADPTPLELDVPIDCTKSKTINGSGNPDGGADDPGATNASNVDGGCTTSGAPAGSGTAVMLLALGFVSVVLRRRRS